MEEDECLQVKAHCEWINKEKSTNGRLWGTRKREGGRSMISGGEAD